MPCFQRLVFCFIRWLWISSLFFFLKFIWNRLPFRNPLRLLLFTLFQFLFIAIVEPTIFIRIPSIPFDFECVHIYFISSVVLLIYIRIILTFALYLYISISTSTSIYVYVYGHVFRCCLYIELVHFIFVAVFSYSSIKKLRSKYWNWRVRARERVPPPIAAQIKQTNKREKKARACKTQKSNDQKHNDK